MLCNQWIYVVACLQLKWFDDPVVQCMRSIDVTDIKDVALKRDFFGVLPQAIPQFPRVTSARATSHQMYNSPIRYDTIRYRTTRQTAGLSTARRLNFIVTPLQLK